MSSYIPSYARNIISQALRILKYFLSVHPSIYKELMLTIPCPQHPPARTEKKSRYQVHHIGLQRMINSREFDSCIIKIVRAGRIKPVLFLSSFSFYYLVIFSDM